MDTIIIQNSENAYFDKKTVTDLKNIHRVNSEILSINRIIYKGILEKDIYDMIEKVIRDSKLLSLKSIKELLFIKEKDNKFLLAIQELKVL